MKQASDVGLDLPLTVRFNRAIDQTGAVAASDDQIEISWDNSTVDWPTGFSLLSANPPLDVTLTHGFSMQLHFGSDTSGYGRPGILETTQGQDVDLEATGPFDVSDLDPPCGSAAVRIDDMTLRPGTPTWGTLNLLGGQVRGSLHVLATINASVTPACGPTWEPTDTYEPTLPPAVNADPVIAIAFTGAFRVSPAITADGRLRLGTINVADTVSSQASSLGIFTLCTAPAGGGCSPQSFPARVKLKALTAELLIGQVPL